MVRIALFLEDSRMEQFLDALIRRVAREVNCQVYVSRYQGAGSGIWVLLKKYLRRVRRARGLEHHLLIIAVDANCTDPAARRVEIQRHLTARYRRRTWCYPGPFVACVPVPYIERWYLCDPAALRQVTGAGLRGPLPAASCEPKHQFKQLLATVVRGSNIPSLAGGLELAEEIVDAMNWGTVRQTAPDLDKFVADLRRHLRSDV